MIAAAYAAEDVGHGDGHGGGGTGCQLLQGLAEGSSIVDETQVAPDAVVVGQRERISSCRVT